VLRISTISILVLLGSASAAAPKQATIPEKEETSLDVTPETSVPIMIGKGKTAEAIIALHANNAVQLSYADAQRLGVTGSSTGQFDFHDKSISSDKMGSRFKTELLGNKKDVYYYWPKLKPPFDHPTVIGPEALGVDFLNMRLGQKLDGEITFGLKLIRFSKVYTGWNASVGTMARIGDQTVAVEFDPAEDKSYALGTVGRRIATNFGGHYVGDPEIPPESNRHAEDPDYRIRKMTMGMPTQLGGLAIDSLYILDSEGIDGKVIPKQQRTDDKDPAFAIVVEAMKKEPRHRSYPTMVIGKDNLAQCSSIAFDFAQDMIYLSCLPHGLAAPVQLSPTGAYFPAKSK
jgi:hypothetical protein